MGFFDNKTFGFIPITAPAYWAGKALGMGGGGQQFSNGQYIPPPTENPDNPVDNNRISQVFQQILGRPANQNEIDAYSKYIKSGDLNYNDIGQIIQGMPEAQQTRLGQYGQQYENYLGASDNAILGKASDQAQGMMARLGRDNSSGYGAQLASAGRDLAINRQNSLAQFYGGGFNNLMGQYQDQGQNALSRGYQLQDSRTNYNRSIVGSAYGYNQQKADQTDYLNQMNRMNRNQAFGQGLGAIAGAGIGAASGGGIAGAGLGASIGSRFGGIFQ